MSGDQEKEYQAFLKAHDAAPSLAVSQKVIAQVHADLNPSSVRVFSKLLGIHAATSLATLAVCPQFGVGFGQSMGLMTYFMELGPYGCLVACGSFFTGVSLLIASLVLRGEEIRRIRQNRLLELGALTLLSLGFFFMLDAQFVFGLTLAWFLGAVLGSAAALEMGWRLRFGAKHISGADLA